ncbi:MAG TPA: hypothetical protein ENN67_00310 [Firmicutes bacterium]|nr:hypothetical protein [Bacillota bacterium]
MDESDIIRIPIAPDDRPIAGSPSEEPYTLYGNESRLPSGTDFTPKLIQPVLPERYRTDEALPDAFGMYGFDRSAGTLYQAFVLPSWELKDIAGYEWNDQNFIGNFTVYIIADISRRHGTNEMLVWNYVIRQLTTNPQAAFPPNVVTIATSLENPYAFNETRVTETLKRVKEQEHCMGVMIIDLDGDLPKSLGYAELPQPVVVFVDYYGYVRMILIGRVKDISNKNIESAMEIISEMWQWDEQEFARLPLPMTILINMLRDEAYMPSKRQAEPLDISRQISPTWGYPFIPDENNSTSE